MQVEKFDIATLYLGDSLELLPSFKGIEADMLFADPPYGMRKKGILNDNLNFDDLLEFNRKWIVPSFDLLKDGGSWYCWGIEEPLMDIYSEILKPLKQSRKITYRNFITWDKVNTQGQKSNLLRSYPRSHESCLFVTKGNKTIKYLDSIKCFPKEFLKIRKLLVEELKKTNINNEIVIKLTGQKYVYGHWIATSGWRMITENHWNILKKYCETNKIKAFEKSYGEFRQEYENAILEWQQNRTYFDNTHENMTSVWNIPRVSSNSNEYCGHPAQKPIALCSRAIKTSCSPSGTVIYPFMGSGSVGVACLMLGRPYIGIEINKKSFDISCKRIEEAIKQNEKNR
ncbi:MAG: site-specific DNA-methyltransferase [Treponema sp.]|nr:site-specific DNA-methyltransferase [Treponema sp.]